MKVTPEQLYALEKFVFTGDDKCPFCGDIIVGEKSFDGEITEWFTVCNGCGAEPYDYIILDVASEKDDQSRDSTTVQITYWQWEIHPDDILRLRKDVQESAHAAARESAAALEIVSRVQAAQDRF